MRRIEWTSAFKKDHRKIARNPHHSDLDEVLDPVILSLANDIPLPPRHHDHALSGSWIDFRDCHVKSDQVLIYLKVGEDTLRLVRLGSHSELFRK
jgi:mRNA interferase YafQ